MYRHFSPFLILLTFAGAPSAGARVIHVPADSSTIQGGIRGAAAGDTVLVAPGTYLEHDIDFLGKAIRVTGTDPTDSSVVAATVVDGDSQGRVFRFQSGEDSTSRLEGLTVTGGRVINGGGISCTSSSPTIASCIIRGNRAGGGGGLWFGASSALVIDCTITDNRSIDYGGGIECSSASPTFENCTIRGNDAPFAGGGINVTSAAAPVFRSCTIAENTLTEPSSNFGGGVSCTLSSTATFWNCAIVDNRAPGFFGLGGGVYTTASSPFALHNCTVLRNEAGMFGGGLYCESSSPSISFCTIAENSATVGGGMYVLGSASPGVDNSILWNNSPEAIFVGSGTPVVTLSDVQGGWPGAGNVDADPRFLTFHGVSHLLHPLSPCIDAGDPALEDGFDWPIWYVNGTRADMGAYGGPDDIGWR